MRLVIQVCVQVCLKPWQLNLLHLSRLLPKEYPHIGCFRKYIGRFRKRQFITMRVVRRFGTQLGAIFGLVTIRSRETRNLPGNRLPLRRAQRTFAYDSTFPRR